MENTFARVGAQAAPNPVVNSIIDNTATLENEKVRIRYDLRRGSYSIIDRRDGSMAIADAVEHIGQWTSDAEGMRHYAVAKDFQDGLGSGQTLTIESRHPGAPTLILEITLREGEGYVELRSGIENTLTRSVRIKNYQPLVSGLISGSLPWTDVQTLDGMSATHQSRVRQAPLRSSANNLLLTFKHSGRRRSLVLGSFKTDQFTKWAHTLLPGGFDARGVELAQSLPGAKLVTCFNCGESETSLPASDPSLPILGIQHGENWGCEVGERNSRFEYVLYDKEEIVVRGEGLDSNKRYAVGWLWWDFGGNGRVESVRAIAADNQSQSLLSPTPLPAFLDGVVHPIEFAAVLPASAYADGQLRISFKNESKARKSSAVVGQVWLWEIQNQTTLPDIWTKGHSLSLTRDHAYDASPVTANLESFDPLGRTVDPGERYLPEDSFYVDCTIDNPFEALEQYGKRLAVATHANPNPYDFPTECAWYVGVWHTHGAQNNPAKSLYQINTTAGLVNEMQKIRDRGFLKYSRVAMRLVPDTYKAINPQGWWDDEHWQQQGYYVAPYQTSRKFGHAVQSLGGLAFTYFQPACMWAYPISEDFRQAHTDLLIGNDVNNTLDYTKPQTVQYMQQKFAAMRGGISGIMVDYADAFWIHDASRGGFADPHATATSYYRTFFRLAKEGLGPESWIHERNLGQPNNDVTLGSVDLQRTSSDTDKISPDMVSRSGLRWYKNRVVINYDMDSKDLNGSWKVAGYHGSNRDGLRMVLTMSYVASSRLLLANSFRDLSPQTLHDLERVCPFQTQRKSARPIDAFSYPGWPRVYDFEINPQWHQLTLYNNTLPTNEETISLSLSGNVVDGALGLERDNDYYAYDFWNDHFVGRFRGTDTLLQTLRPGEARMLSIHQAEPNPQFLSTNRHIMQGYLDMTRWPQWDAASQTLSGESKVVGDEPYEIVIALNGREIIGCSAVGADAKVRSDNNQGLATLTLNARTNAIVPWNVRFK